MKCETPARERGSSRDPVAIQSPSATERTPEMRSLAMRSPPRSVVICGSRIAAILDRAPTGSVPEGADPMSVVGVSPLR